MFAALEVPRKILKLNSAELRSASAANALNGELLTSNHYDDLIDETMQVEVEGALAALLLRGGLGAFKYQHLAPFFVEYLQADGELSNRGSVIGGRPGEILHASFSR